jgi:curli biogenesis system outer membrane secretion channel CsgG
MKKIILLFLILPALQAAEKQRIAVMEFKADAGVETSLVSSLENILTTELVKTGRFDVLERRNIDVILQEQSFQNSGCTESSCAV